VFEDKEISVTPLLKQHAFQGWIYWGVQGVCTPPSPGQRGGKGGGGAIFHDKPKIIRDKMRYSNLSDNMMISKL
jgi:hypothetical protein